MTDSIPENNTSQEPTLNAGWIRAILSILFLFIVIFSVHFQSIISAIDLWVHSGAYNHCFIIAPIAATLIWLGRDRLRGLDPTPTVWGLAPMLAFGCVWLLSFLSGISEGTHLAVVGLIESALLTVLGWRICWRMLIPFQYLWLMVPTGTFLIPPLQAITATFSAGLLELTGIPVFREGLMIEVPSGTYFVAPGCAGLNFLLAGLAVSLAFSDQVYRDWSRRLGFVFLLLILAVVGNVVRVFMIIVFAHLTGNVGNIVEDHVLYGWGFFSLLMWGAMTVGSRYAQTDAPSATGSPVDIGSGASMARLVTLTLLAAALTLAVPLGGRAFWPDRIVAAGSISAPTLTCGTLSPATDSRALDGLASRGDALASIACGDGTRTLHGVVVVLARPLRHGKLLGLERWIQDEKSWKRTDQSVRELTLDGATVPVLSERWDWGDRFRLVASARRIGGVWRAPGFDTALADLIDDLSGRRRALLVLADVEGDQEDPGATALLRDFLVHLAGEAAQTPTP